MSNARMISSGARGRGATDGNASAGLVYTRLKSAASAQSFAGVAAQARTRNCRSAETRPCEPGSGSPVTGGRSIALTWTLPTR
jgi:hypothetical protein